MRRFSARIASLSCLAFGTFAVVVDAAGCVVGELGDRRDVDRVVDLTVAFEVQSMMRLGPDDAETGAVAL